MLKIVDNTSFNWGDESLGSIIKMSSKGLIGSDRQDFIKSASVSLLDTLDSIKVKPGEELVHLIALGDTEEYGPNRNGDGFTKKACQDYHHYFVKDARVYRNHKNTDPKKSYGIVKASAFNDDMHRVELIVALNSNEKAAQANHGLVADKEMEKLASDKPLAVSMACRVPFDECSFCKNRASTRDEYCTDIKHGGHCKAGGLKNNLGKIVSVDGELHHLHADNTKPYFFDISHVFVPADRIAYASGFCKKGSAELVGGAELAELYGLTLPEKHAEYYGTSRNCDDLVQIFVDAVADFHTNKGWTKVATYLPIVDTKPLQNPESVWQFKTATITKGLNDANICLTPTQFVQLETGLDLQKSAQIGEVIGPLSNERYRELLTSDTIYNPYMPAVKAAEKVKDWCYTQKCARWKGDGYFLKQASYNSCFGLPPVTISRENIYGLDSDPDIQNLSKNFALYKLAFLSSIPKEKQSTVAKLLVGRDYLSY